MMTNMMNGKRVKILAPFSVDPEYQWDEFTGLEARVERVRGYEALITLRNGDEAWISLRRLRLVNCG